MNILFLAFIAVFVRAEAAMVTVNVTIQAPAETGYSLSAGETSRIGRMSALEGLAAEASIEAQASGESIPVVMEFYDSEGLLARCKTVEVRVRGNDAACDPKFMLASDGPGPRSMACRGSCEPSNAERRKKISRGWVPLNPWLPPLER